MIFTCFCGFVCLIAGSLKVKPFVNVKNEEVSKDDQLSLDVKNLNLKDEVSNDGSSNGKRAKTFTFEELAAATGNFRSDCFVGEGGFGKVYQGYLDKINQVGTNEFIISYDLKLMDMICSNVPTE